MNYEGVKLSEISHTEKDKNHMILPMWNIKQREGAKEGEKREREREKINQELIDKDNRSVVTRREGD